MSRTPAAGRLRYGLSSGAEGVKVGFHGTGPVVDLTIAKNAPELFSFRSHSAEKVV